ncbi:hypothetical protein HK405_001681, partial [Cladochytrium tenue]
ILGFLTGVTLTGASLYSWVVEEWQASSASLLGSVEDLQRTTRRVQAYASRIEGIERDVRDAKDRGVGREDLAALRTELLRAVDEVNVAQLQLKTELWDITQDVKALAGQQPPPKQP